MEKLALNKRLGHLYVFKKIEFMIKINFQLFEPILLYFHSG